MGESSVELNQGVDGRAKDPFLFLFSEPIMKSACCYKTLDKPCILAGTYTLILYTGLVVMGTINISTFDAFLRLLCTLLLISSVSCVISSILLIIGVCVGSRKLFRPWIVSIIISSSLDLAICFYILIQEPFTKGAILFVITDLSFCLFNIYLLMIIMSLYCFLDRESRNNFIPRSNRAENIYSHPQQSRQLDPPIVEEMTSSVMVNLCPPMGEISSCRDTETKLMNSS